MDDDDRSFEELLLNGELTGDIMEFLTDSVRMTHISVRPVDTGLAFCIEYPDGQVATRFSEGLSKEEIVRAVNEVVMDATRKALGI